MQLSIFECQPGLFCRPTGAACYDAPYTYAGFDRGSGLHKFTQGGKLELFAKRKGGYAGWHLKRGAYCYEFVRSA